MDYDEIITGLYKHIEDGGFPDPALRFLAESVRAIAVELRRRDEYAMEMRERNG